MDRAFWAVLWPLVVSLAAAGAVAVYIGHAETEGDVPLWPVIPLAALAVVGLYLFIASQARHWPYKPAVQSVPALRIHGGNTDEYHRMDVISRPDAELARFGGITREAIEAAEDGIWRAHATVLIVENVGTGLARNPVLKVTSTDPPCYSGAPQPRLDWCDDGDIPPTGKGFAVLSRFFHPKHEMGFVDAQSFMWAVTAFGQPMELEVEAWCDDLDEPERACFTVSGFARDKYLSVTLSERASED